MTEPSRKIVLTPASRIRTGAPRWLWDTATFAAAGPEHEGRIPVGQLTIAAGRAGIGKSQHAAWLTANLTRGTLPGHWYGTPKSVIYAATEDSWPITIAPRLIAAGADLDRVFRIDVRDDEDRHARVTIPRDTHLLEAAIIENDVALMVLDPLLSLLDVEINDYRAREVRDALEPLLPIADRTGCALFGLAHFTKATGSDPLLLIAGSGAFGQLVRAGIGYARDDSAGDVDDPSYVLSTIKSNLGRENLPSLQYRIEPAQVATDDGPAWVSRLVFTGASDRSVRDLLRDSLDTGNGTERDEAVEWLTAYLNEHGAQAPAGEVIRAASRDGIARATLDRARRRAGITTSKGGMSGGWTWYLPAGRTHEEPEHLTHTGVRPSSSSAGSSRGLKAVESASEPTVIPFPAKPESDAEPTRPCGHVGDPATRCGTCIAERYNATSTGECRCCGATGRPLDTAGICDRSDRDHDTARRIYRGVS